MLVPDEATDLTSLLDEVDPDDWTPSEVSVVLEAADRLRERLAQRLSH